MLTTFGRYANFSDRTGPFVVINYTKLKWAIANKCDVL